MQKKQLLTILTVTTTKAPPKHCSVKCR